MTLSSSDAKAAFLAFEEDLSGIVDDLYEAVTEDVPPNKRKAALQTARRKLAAHEELLSQLSARQKDEAIESFGTYIDAIKEYLSKAKGG